MATYRQNVKYTADDVDTQRSMISDKITDAFSMVTDSDMSIIQFWAPVTAISGRRLLSTSGQPFAVTCLHNIIHHHDVNNNKQADINEQDGRDFNPFIINDAPTATAFLNRLPQLLVSCKDLKGASSLVDSALECQLTTSYIPPICFPSQRTSCCIGVVEFSTNTIFGNETIIPMIRALEEVGLGVFQVQERIPSQIISDLKPARDEIENVLKIVCKSNEIALAQVWIASEDDNHVSSSSYLEGTRKKQMFSLKLGVI